MKARASYTVGSDAKKEIRRQCVELNNEYTDDLEYMVAWVLHKYYGFGLKRLLQFRKNYVEEFKRLVSVYETGDIYPARVKLKEMGYNVETLNEGVKHGQ